MIIDSRRVPGVSGFWIMGHVRAGRERVIEEVEAAGIPCEGEPLELRANYFLELRKLS